MTTTMMLAGNASPRILFSMEKGIYAVDFSGGRLISRQKVCFSMRRRRLKTVKCLPCKTTLIGMVRAHVKVSMVVMIYI